MMELLVKFAVVSILLLLSTAYSEERLATWNLQWFPGRVPVAREDEKAIHISLVHEELAKFDPTVFLFQEVEDRNAVELAIRIYPEMKVRAVSQFSRIMGSSQQLAIASITEPVVADFVRFEAGETSPPRGFVWALFKDEQQTFLVYNVHLKSNRGGIEQNIPVREESARRIVSHVRNLFVAHSLPKATMVLIAGDFNTDPTKREFEHEQTNAILEAAGFCWCFEGVPASKRITWPSNGNFPDNTFDGFYFSKEHVDLVSDVAVRIGSERASDHRIVTLVLEEQE